MNSSRRSFLQTAAGASSVALASSSASAGPVKPRAASDFTFCFNTSTIREQTKDIVEHIQIAGDAGYDGIEPWIRNIQAYKDGGGSLSDLRKRISDTGLTVDSAIGFAQWIVDDEKQRKAGLEQAKRDMELLAEIGGTRIAAPPIGAHRNAEKIDLFKVAERYRALLEVGDETGVVPQLEVWGFSNNLSRLGESVFACVESGHPKACLLADVYHIFKGGSDFTGLGLLDNNAMHVFHMNDYPAEPAREEMSDADRVYPGDGVAPLSTILNMIGGHGRTISLSLELFNRDYWKQPAIDVAKTGLEKMKTAVKLATA